ncbi:FabG Dehydrogenases with different specificities (related to short-chain alcohol dehydrogenases) [Candidatus Nanopelagicaceae bacterium]
MGVVETKQQALLLVGASGGVGAALLEYLSSRTTLACLPTYKNNKPTESKFPWIHYDSNNHDSTKSMFEELHKRYEIQVVIDASGAFFASRIEKSTSQVISGVITTNLLAPLVLAKYAQEFMQIGGKIIFMSSIVSTMQLIGSSAYAASKAGLERGIISLGPEFSQTGHGICGIRLGYMDYGMTYKINEKVRKEILSGSSMEKFIEIGVLGEMILEILKTETSKMNGLLYEIK